MVKPSRCLIPLTIVPLVSLLGQIHTNVIPAPYPVKGGHTCNITTVDVQSFVCTVKPKAQALTTCIHSKKKEIPVILRAGYHRNKKNCKVFPETECQQAFQFHNSEHKQWKKTVLSARCSSITLEKWEQVFMTKGNFCPD
jgi:hypothetical protein